MDKNFNVGLFIKILILTLVGSILISQAVPVNEEQGTVTIKPKQVEPLQRVELATTPIAESAKITQAVVAMPTGSHEDWMTQAGIPQSEWQYVNYIVSKESGWSYTAVNASSGATGLCQSLPASKMASSGADYLTNPITQLKWCHGYAMARYGGWSGAYNFWTSAHWW